VLVDEFQNIVETYMDFVNDKSSLDLLEHLLKLYNEPTVDKKGESSDE
jgi:hypothetical protein